MGSPCADGTSLGSLCVACVGDGGHRRLIRWVGPEGDERDLPLPRVPWRHRSPLRSRPVWVEWRWGGGFTAAVTRIGQEEWRGYPSGYDGDQEGLDTTDEDDAIAWLLTHPPTLWVERCAVDGSFWAVWRGDSSVCDAPFPYVLCAPAAAAPATPDELRRLAREVLRG